MDSLNDRDLSGVPDDKLTPAERKELKRRLKDFVLAVRKRHASPAAAAPKKRVTKWDPTQQARKVQGKSADLNGAPATLRRAG